MADPKAISYEIAKAIVQHLDPVSVLLLSYKLTEDSTRRWILMYGIFCSYKENAGWNSELTGYLQ